MSTHILKETRFLFKKEQKPVVGLVVFFILHSNIKNNFTIGPLISNSSGEIVISDRLINEVINSDKAQFPMDYGGEVSDCHQMSILIEPITELEEQVNKLQPYYPANAARLSTFLQTASNSQINFRKQIPFPCNKRIVVLNIN